MDRGSLKRGGASCYCVSSNHLHLPPKMHACRMEMEVHEIIGEGDDGGKASGCLEYDIVHSHICVLGSACSTEC
jgi:hypothetical protein